MKLFFILLIYLLYVKNIYATEFINVKSPQKEGVAITLDACGGKTDKRILEILIKNKIPSTIFVTSKWITFNKEAINLINENKELFSIQNHGYEHKEAVYGEIGAYGLPTVKNEDGLKKEVLFAAKDIEKNFNELSRPTWYRTAGALYDEKTIQWILYNGWKIAGYTIAVDEGGTASTNKIISNMKKAKNGDIMLIHLNRPKSNIYDGFSIGLKYLIDNKVIFNFLN